jgi:hypothetical protein
MKPVRITCLQAETSTQSPENESVDPNVQMLPGTRQSHKRNCKKTRAADLGASRLQSLPVRNCEKTTEDNPHQIHEDSDSEHAVSSQASVELLEKRKAVSSLF